MGTDAPRMTTSLGLSFRNSAAKLWQKGCFVLPRPGFSHQEHPGLWRRGDGLEWSPRELSRVMSCPASSLPWDDDSTGVCNGRHSLKRARQNCVFLVYKSRINLNGFRAPASSCSCSFPCKVEIVVRINEIPCEALGGGPC